MFRLSSPLDSLVQLTTASVGHEGFFRVLVEVQEDAAVPSRYSGIFLNFYKNSKEAFVPNRSRRKLNQAIQWRRQSKHGRPDRKRPVQSRLGFSLSDGNSG